MTGKLVLIKRVAAWLLLLCLVLPLSKCEGKVDPDSGIRAAATVHYGYAMLTEFAQSVGQGPFDAAMGVLAVLGVFMLPLLSLALRKAWEPVVCIIGAGLLYQPLVFWVYVMGRPMFGGLLASACWIVILLLSCLQLWGYRKRRA